MSYLNEIRSSNLRILVYHRRANLSCQVTQLREMMFYDVKISFVILNQSVRRYKTFSDPSSGQCDCFAFFMSCQQWSNLSVSPDHVFGWIQYGRNISVDDIHSFFHISHYGVDNSHDVLFMVVVRLIFIKINIFL
jgi:hypothetical protein